MRLSPHGVHTTRVKSNPATRSYCAVAEFRPSFGRIAAWLRDGFSVIPKTRVESITTRNLLAGQCVKGRASGRMETRPP